MRCIDTARARRQDYRLMPRLAPRFNPALLLCGLLLLVGGGRLLAHAVPSLTVEALFKSDRSYELKVSIDARLFLSDKPTTLPPVEASWYRNQTPEQLAETEKRSTEYLEKALSLAFSGQAEPLPEDNYQAMDGATGQPLSAESKEVHLLATMRATMPAPAKEFTLSVGKDANTSVILILSKDGEAERRPQVLFPGETSRPFALPGESDDEPVVTTVEIQEVSRAGPLIAVLTVGGVAFLLVLVSKLFKRAEPPSAHHQD